MIDAAEFVGPFQDRQLGLHKAAKFYYTTGWHETATVSELLINKAAWDKLPKDLQAIVENACAACNVISEAWCQRTNAEAMEDLVKNQGVIARPLPDDVLEGAARGHRQGAGRGGRQGPDDEEGARLVHGLQGEVRRLGRLQRGRLPRQDPGGLTRCGCDGRDRGEGRGIDRWVDVDRRAASWLSLASWR